MRIVLQSFNILDIKTVFIQARSFFVTQKNDPSFTNKINRKHVVSSCTVFFQTYIALYPRYLKMQVYSTPVFIQSFVARSPFRTRLYHLLPCRRPPYRGRPCASSCLALNKNKSTLNPASSGILGIYLSNNGGCGFL
jgi:hypothetical protein